MNHSVLSIQSLWVHNNTFDTRISNNYSYQVYMPIFTTDVYTNILDGRCVSWRCCKGWWCYRCWWRYEGIVCETSYLWIWKVINKKIKQCAFVRVALGNKNQDATTSSHSVCVWHFVRSNTYSTRRVMLWGLCRPWSLFCVYDAFFVLPKVVETLSVSISTWMNDMFVKEGCKKSNIEIEDESWVSISI